MSKVFKNPKAVVTAMGTEAAQRGFVHGTYIDCGSFGVVARYTNKTNDKTAVIKYAVNTDTTASEVSFLRVTAKHGLRNRAASINERRSTWGNGVVRMDTHFVVSVQASAIGGVLRGVKVDRRGLVEIVAIVMREAVGSLRYVVDRQFRSHPDLLLNWLIEIHKGIVTLHKLHVIVCDLKADNVLITMSDRAVLADLGCAAWDGDRIVCGTFGVSAPETAHRADPTVDIYGFTNLVQWCIRRVPIMHRELASFLEMLQMRSYLMENKNRFVSNLDLFYRLRLKRKRSA